MKSRVIKSSVEDLFIRKLTSLSQIRFPLHPVCDRDRAGKRREGDYCRYRASVLCYVLGTVLSVLRYIHGDTAILCTDRHARRTPDCLIDCLNTLRAPVPRTQTRTTAFCIDVLSTRWTWLYRVAEDETNSSSERKGLSISGVIEIPRVDAATNAKPHAI